MAPTEPNEPRPNLWLVSTAESLPQWQAEFRSAMELDLRAMASGKRGCCLEEHWRAVVEIARGGLDRGSDTCLPTYRWILGVHSLLTFVDACCRGQR